MMDNSDSHIYDLNHELSSSVKKVLLQRIVFKEAKIPDTGHITNHKHKPLNERYRDHVVNTLRQTSKKGSQNNDILKAPVVLFSPDKLELEWKEIRRIGPGLANLGNTCFLNSVLQVLTYTPPLVNYLLSGYHKSKCRGVGFCMQCELVGHVNKVRVNNQSGSIRPMSIIQKLNCIGKNFHFGRQEDAHEFLRYVVEGIQKSDYADKPKMDKLSKETTVANAIFGGFFRSQVKCLQCHYESNTFDPMMDLNIDIKDCTSLLQGLHRTVRPDRLDGENKYFCEKCRTKRIAQKRGNIHKEPNVLTLQLKRFDFTRMFGGKICKEVSFPEELNIRPFMSVNQGEPIIYKLYGVLVHSGFSCNSGHYYCYVKAPNGTWYEMNDNRVTQVGLKTVLQAQAYILFYIKKNSIKPRPTHQPMNEFSKKNNIPSASLSVSSKAPFSASNTITVQSHAQSPVVKPFSVNTAEKQRINIVSTDPLGTLIKKKPKINWTQSSISSENLVSQSMTASKSTLSESSNNITQANSLNKPIKSSSQNVDGEKSKPPLNNLQKLSESYGGCGESREASPESGKVAGSRDQVQVKQESKEVNTGGKNPLTETTNLVNHNNANVIKKEVPESKPPFKLKLKDGKQFIHNKFNIWSPLTKGNLYPRAILNKCVFGNENDQSKVQIFEKKKKIADADTAWKEEKIQQPDKLFGPMCPPPPGAIHKGSSSLTSETSSTGSVQTQSGEWDVLEKEKPCENAQSTEESKVDGWNVLSTSSASTPTLLEEKYTSNEVNENRVKKKKKKKKKRKHHREEIISGQVELKLLSLEKRKHEEEDTDSESDTSKTHRDSLQLKSTVSIPLPFSLRDGENNHHKKKKKKHKRRYSLVIDTNKDNIGGINIPIEVKPSKKPDVSSTCISSSKKECSISTMQGHASSYTLSNAMASSNKCESGLNNLTPFGSVVSHLSNKEKSDKMHMSDKDFRHVNGNEHTPGMEGKGRNEVDSDAFKSSDNTLKSAINVTNSYLPLKRDEIQSTSTKVSNSDERKKEIPTHLWSDSKKKQCVWDGANNKTDTVSYLLNGGSKVHSWEGNERSFIYNKRKNEGGEAPQDDWDEEYDKGQTRKKRKLENEEDNYKSKSNVFQEYQNYKNSKDKHPSMQAGRHKYHDQHHQHKKRKVHNDGNRFL